MEPSEFAFSWEPWLHSSLHFLALAVGVAGVLVLVYGVVVAGIKLVRAELLRFRGLSPRREEEELRHVLGLYILLGLEFLVAADIIETITAPDLDSILVLGAIVLIRTVISFSINWELAKGKVQGREET